MKKIAFYSIVILALMFSNCNVEEADTDDPSTETLTDYDGNVYHSIKIGSQTWMLENLKVTCYRNGDSIRYTPGNEWPTATAGAYCYYNNDTANKDIYGALYNWFAATDSRNIAPKGWHVPSSEELTILRDYLEDDAGGKMKKTGTSLWSAPNTGATNKSGFTALPSGTRDYCGGAFKGLGNNCFFWSSSSYNDSDAHEFYLEYDNAYFTPCAAPKTYGISLRLLKD